MPLKELYKNRLKVPHQKVSEHNAANTAPIGRTGKRRRKEGNSSVEERGCHSKRQNTS